jgi:hypothetical protein
MKKLCIALFAVVLLGFAPTILSADSLTNDQYVTYLYKVVLDRAPDSGGFNGWVNALNTNALTSWQVALDFLDSQEYQTDEVTSYYQDFLGRAPDPGGLTGWVNDLAGGASDESVKASFLSSTEFWNDLGTPVFPSSSRTNAGWINQVYLDVLGRNPGCVEGVGCSADSGAYGWVIALDNGASLYSIAFQIMQSQEYFTDVVTWDYNQYQVTPRLVPTYVNLFEGGASDQQVGADILNSISPEPSSLVLLGTGLLGLAFVAFRKAKASGLKLGQ